MKKSLIIRWIIIAVIVLGWALSMLPMSDRDILDEFKSRAEKQVAAYQKEKEACDKAGGKEAVVEKMRAIEDKMSGEYLELQKMYVAQDKLDDYKELESRIDKLLKEQPENLSKKDRTKLSYRLLEKAASAEMGKRISLNDFVKVSKNSKLSNANVMRYLRRKASGKLTLGLDLQGGTEFVVSFDEDEVLAKDPKANIEWTRDQIRTILDNRLNKLGVTEPEIRVEGPTSISIKMPAVSEGDKASIRKTIQDSAKLSFHLLQPFDEKGQPCEMQTVSLISKSEDGDELESDIQIRKEPTEVLGEDIERAAPQQDQFGQWSVGLSFNQNGAAAFGRVTAANVGQQMAIVMDGKVYSAPVIQGAITGGQAQITGNFTLEEARQLATVIASGNLPADIQITSEFGTDPTLGADSVASGFWAGLLGLAIVIVFMVWYYKVAGVIADLALVVNTVLVLGSMSLLHATITMPGIAGMVLTIGMAVDANVIIFERIREELQKGKAIGNAIKSGYDRAFSAIFDSNLTTLITCFFLYKFGSGSVRGFAVTLACGIFASMFTAIFMTRAIFDALVFHDVLKGLPMRVFQSLTNPHFDILKLRKIATRSSIAVIIICLVGCIIHGGRILGIEFSGGTQISYILGEGGEKPTVEAIRDAVKGVKGMEEARIGYKSGEGGNEVLEITVPVAKEAKTDEEKAAEDAAIKKYNAADKAFYAADEAAKKAAEALTEAQAAADKARSDSELAAKKAADNKDEKLVADLKLAVESAAKTAADKATALTAATEANASAVKALADAVAARKAADTELAGVQGRVDPNALLEVLDNAFANAKFIVGGTKIVGAHVGSQFRVDAFWAAVTSIIGVIIYLAFRFELKYGVAAVVAVIHDAIIAGGLYLTFGGRFTPTILAAIMTIIGYSLNDTIVIFDRLRETRRMHPNTKFYDLVNDSINATLSRTFITTITTMFVTFTIMVLSGGDIQAFAIVMFIGLIVGTYSSVCLAPSLVNTWEKKALRRNGGEAPVADAKPLPVVK